MCGSHCQFILHGYKGLVLRHPLELTLLCRWIFLPTFYYLTTSVLMFPLEKVLQS